MLHTVNKSPTQSNALSSCLRVVQPSSAVLLIEDGVYAALAGSDSEMSLLKVMASNTLYALTADVIARGLGERILAGIQLVDYDGFVALTEQHPVSQSWY